MKNKENIYARLPDNLQGEYEEIIFAQKDLRIMRILSRSHQSEIYEQAEDEWVIVLEGEAEINFPAEDESVQLKKGDYLYLKAGRRHQVTMTSDPCLWLCLFFSADSS